MWLLYTWQIKSEKHAVNNKIHAELSNVTGKTYIQYLHLLMTYLYVNINVIWSLSLSQFWGLLILNKERESPWKPGHILIFTPWSIESFMQVPKIIF